MSTPTIPATAHLLRKTLDRRPVLWVGAGLSIAAGLPSTARLCEAMIAEADDAIGPALPFELVADAFVASMGGGALGDLLQRQIGGSHALTPLHRAISRSAADGKFAAIVTTNYDDLLERALAEAEVRFVHQVLEANAVVVDAGADLRLLKLHGSRDDWQQVILSGASYAAFAGRYPFLEKQLHVLLRQQPVLFVGCSLLDPRIGDWLDGLDADAIGLLKPWRAAITTSAWQAAIAARPSLLRAPFKALALDDHGHLARLWHDVALVRTPAGEMTIDIEIGASRLVARVDGGAEWSMANPLDDLDFLASIEVLRDLGIRPVASNRHGKVATDVALQLVAELERNAEQVGDALTALLSDPARERLVQLEATARGGSAALLRLRVATGAGGDEALADRLLALPWELLRIAGRFPVSTHTVDLVREAVVPGLPGLGEPTDELKVVVTVSAPVDQLPVDYENEIYWLWQALGSAHEGRLQVTDLGTLEELAAEVAACRPAVIHFTGHGEPGALLFESDTAASRPVPVKELVDLLHVSDGLLPRLIYLSTCHGASVNAGGKTELAAIREDERMVDLATTAALPSTAAALHRGGFAQVLGYFGPVGDTQATRIAAKFYGGLAAGKTARAALREAREEASRPLPLADGWGVYPLGWAQMALYHRGLDRATTLLAKGAAGPLIPPARSFKRLDKKGGTQRVERRHDDPVVGVQQLREGMGFVGRRKPRSIAIGRWRQGQRLLVVQGLGGLGKTALCAELLRLLTDGKVIALDGRWAGAQPDPIAALWQEVQATRQDDAWSQRLATIQQDHGLSAEGLVHAVAALAELEGELTLYLDDAESLMLAPAQGTPLGAWRDEQVAALWRGLAAMARDGRVGVLASSRYLPTGTPPSATLHLEPMSRWEILKLMAWLPTLQRLPHADRDWLSTKIDGHPRTLEWLEVLAAQKEQKLASPDGNFRGSWRTAILEPILEKVGAEIDADLLLRLIWQALDDPAREHLGRASVLEAPAPWEVIQALAPDADDTSARRLADAGLLSPFQGPTGDSWWKPHGLVIAAIAPLWSGDPAAAHRRLGGAFRDLHATKSDPLLAQRAIEHLCAGGDGDSAWPLARLLALSLRGAGRYREALGWVEKVLAAGVGGPRLGMAIKLQVELTRKTGTLATDFEDRLLQALDLVEARNKGDILYELGGLCQALGQLSAAAEYLQKAVDFEVEDKGEESFDVAASLHELARVLKAQGDLPAARRHLERSLEIQAKVFGSEPHPSIATSLHSLAGVLQAQGDLPAARRHLERSLEIKAQVFGSELHPDVAVSLHQLASVLKAQGDLPAARRHLERSLEIKAKVFGSELHPDVAASLHELAGVLQAQGDLPAARRHLERSLEIKVKVFGSELHPDVAASLHSLAGVLQAQGDLPAARELLERALAIDATIYGSREHYSTAITETNLGLLLVRLGEIEKGLGRLTHAYGVFQRQLGDEHPSTRQVAKFIQAASANRSESETSE